MKDLPCWQNPRCSGPSSWATWSRCCSAPGSGCGSTRGAARTPSACERRLCDVGWHRICTCCAHLKQGWALAVILNFIYWKMLFLHDLISISKFYWKYATLIGLAQEWLIFFSETDLEVTFELNCRTTNPKCPALNSEAVSSRGSRS